MQQINYITMNEIAEVKKCVESLYQQGETVGLEIRRSRTKGEFYEVKIEDVYAKFFTVREQLKKMAITVQYVDVLTGIVNIAQLHNN